MEATNTPQNNRKRSGYSPKFADYCPNWTEQDIDELRLGMIKSALEEIRDNRRSLPMRKEAYWWLMSNDSDNPMSALNCCLALGLDIHRLRYLMNRLTNGGLRYEPK